MHSSCISDYTSEHHTYTSYSHNSYLASYSVADNIGNKIIVSLVTKFSAEN